MVPEAKLGRRTDALADTYSLGVTLYQMLTGALPDELSQTEKTPDPHRPTSGDSGMCSRDFFKTIEFDTFERYQSIDVLIGELEAYATTPHSTPSPAGGVIPESQPAQPSPLGASDATSPEPPEPPSGAAGTGAGMTRWIAQMVVVR